MFLVLGGFLVLAVLSAGIVNAVFKYGFKEENPTDDLWFWIASIGLAVILGGIYVSYITTVTDITFVDK